MQKTIKRVGIIGKYCNPDILETLLNVILSLESNGCSILLDSDTIFSNEKLKNYNKVSRSELVANSDLIISIGGDGSFLASSRSIIESSKPITGVNMGRLGFLTDISPNEINTIIPQILDNNYKEERRTVISVKVIREGKEIANNIAINDVVVHKSSVARMVELDVYLDGLFLSSYRSDGLIVSTPTGSTAYALSSGGPIIQGNLDALEIVPICPHTLTQRPIVIDANMKQVIKVSESNEVDLQVTIDGQLEIKLQTGDEIHVTRHKKDLIIYHPSNYDMFRRFRKKLGWGTNPND